MTLVTSQSKQQLTFEQFLEQDVVEEGRYELVDGEIVKILPTRKHENIADFIADAFKDEVKRLNLNYRVSDRIVIRTLTADNKEQGRQPDVSVVDRMLWNSNLTVYSAALMNHSAAPRTTSFVRLSSPKVGK